MSAADGSCVDGVATEARDPARRARLDRAVLDGTMAFAIVVIDPRGKITEWNAGAELILGWTADEIRGETAERFFTPEDRAAGRVAVEMRTALETGRANDERWHLRRDGTRFWASGEMTPLRDAAGAHLGFVKVLQDRTAEHRMDADLREAGARLRRAQEAGGVGLFAVDLAANTLHATPEFCRLYGLPVQQTFLARDVEALVLAEDRASISDAARRLLGDTPRDVEYRIRRADDGETRWIARKGEFERDDEGRPTRFVGVVRDITEHRAARDAVSRSEMRYRGLFEAIDAGFCIVEMKFDADERPVDFRYIEVNHAFERQSGLSNPVGRWVNDVVANFEQYWLDTYGRVALTGEPARLENGSETLGRWFDVFAFRIGEPAARQVAILFNDLSARKRSEMALRESQERLHQALSAGQGIGTWDWDVANDKVTADERFATLYGVEPRVAIDGAPIARFFGNIHPDDLAKLRPAIAESLRTGCVFSEEYRLLQADGSIRWVAARGGCRLDDDGRPLRFPGVSFDITERKQAEARQAALLELSDRTRDLADPAALASVAAEILGQTLGVSHVGYGMIDTLADMVTIERDWAAPGLRSLVGTHDFRIYGTYIDDLKHGRTVVFSDARTDPRTKAHAAALEAVEARAVINMPVVEKGRFVALLFANSATVRVWSDSDLGLMREVANRVHAAAERLRAEAARRESEEQFRVFAQAVPNQIWVSRRDGHLDWFNEQVYAYTGAAPGSLDGATAWAGIVHPNDLERAAEAWERSLATGTVYETEFRIRRADGAYRWFLVRAVPVKAADGGIARWVGTNTDIDERRRQAAELKRLNAVLAGQVETTTRERDRVWTSTNDLMGVAGLDGYLKTVNPAWTRMLGWSEAELLATPFVELVDPADHAETADVVRRLAAQEAVTDFVDHVAQKDGGQRTIMWDATPDGDLFHIVGRDITALRQTEEQLRQSQKMEAVGQLTGGLAHDFNNLLTGITGSLELLGIRIAQGRYKDVERYTAAAQGAAKRAAALTHRLLAFSRRQTLDPKATDANRLVAGMEELVRRTVGPGIELEIVAAGGLWTTLVDPHQLENALLNLCINARDAMPEGGRLTIETANRRLDAHAAEDHDMEAGPYISLCVSDNGTGMPPEVVAKAFDPFFTTKPLGAGTGLGLSMIYGFARQSGGQVRIYSEVGLGTNVCLYLPRHVGEEAQAETAPDLAEAPRARAGETVLVVDDEPTVRMLVTEVLEDLGYAAIEAADGASGLKLLESDTRIDLLVTDVGLPGGMNGRQMADAARRVRPALKILFITGYAENAVVGNGHLAPGMHVMTKPFAMEMLAARIKELIMSGA